MLPSTTSLEAHSEAHRQTFSAPSSVFHTNLSPHVLPIDSYIGLLEDWNYPRDMLAVASYLAHQVKKRLQSRGADIKPIISGYHGGPDENNFYQIDIQWQAEPFAPSLWIEVHVTPDGARIAGDRFEAEPIVGFRTNSTVEHIQDLADQVCLCIIPPIQPIGEGNDDLVLK